MASSVSQIIRPQTAPSLQSFSLATAPQPSEVSPISQLWFPERDPVGLRRTSTCDLHTFMGLSQDASLKDTVAHYLTRDQVNRFDTQLRQLGDYDAICAALNEDASETVRATLSLRTLAAADALYHIGQELRGAGVKETEPSLTVINGLWQPPPTLNGQP
jgi:hypothetical protein